MKKIIIVLLIISAFVVGCTEYTNLTEEIVPFDQSKEESKKIIEEKPFCTDSCLNSSCEGPEKTLYVECIVGDDGCKQELARGEVIGECGIECFKDSDCSNNDTCVNHVCEMPPEERLYKFNLSEKDPYQYFKINYFFENRSYSLESHALCNSRANCYPELFSGLSGDIYQIRITKINEDPFFTATDVSLMLYSRHGTYTDYYSVKIKDGSDTSITTIEVEGYEVHRYVTKEITLEELYGKMRNHTHTYETPIRGSGKIYSWEIVPTISKETWIKQNTPQHEDPPKDPFEGVDKTPPYPWYTYS